MGAAKGSRLKRHSGLVAAFTLMNGLLATFFAVVHLGEQHASWDFLFGDHGKASTASGGLGPTVKLPNVVVKLQSSNVDLYVDASFELEVATEQDQAAVRKRMAVLREATIGILSGLTPSEVRGRSEIQRTKDRLLERFRAVVPSGELRALYVNNFIVD